MNDPAIMVEGLTKRFGDVVALAGIDFAVPAGTVLGLLGPNGAGKTTAVRILTTIVTPDEGRATVRGFDVVTRAERVRASIGLAGQYAAVDENLTGRENLRLVGRLTHLPKALARRRADELLERFDLVEAADRSVGTYSGGMRRRLDVSAALVHRPPVLFLDEPTTGLDLRSRAALWSVIEELVSEGTTVLLTTQYLEEADRLAHQIVVVDHGSVIAGGTTAELKASLGSTVLHIEVADPAAARRGAELLAPLVASAPRVDDASIELTVQDGSRLLLAVLRALDAADLAPTGLSLREPSLDDVFLSVTGHRASDGSAEPSTSPPGSPIPATRGAR